jgi:hypothetical protein
MTRILLILAFALGLTVSAQVVANDPMPHCFPCPDVR